MQNEPNAFPNFLKNETMERDFAKNYIGPALAKAGFGTDKLNLCH